MALQTTGAISLGDINVELGRARTSAISLDTAENGGYAAINQNSASRPSSTNPATVSEWRGYNHSAAAAISFNWTLFRLGPTGGVLTITKNGVNVLTSSTSGASGSIAVAAGDVMVMSITHNIKDALDLTSLYLYDQNGLLTSKVTMDANSSISWTLASGKQYTLNATQDTAA